MSTYRYRTTEYIRRNFCGHTRALLPIGLRWVAWVQVSLCEAGDERIDGTWLVKATVAMDSTLNWTNNGTFGKHYSPIMVKIITAKAAAPSWIRVSRQPFFVLLSGGLAVVICLSVNTGFLLHRILLLSPPETVAEWTNPSPLTKQEGESSESTNQQQQPKRTTAPATTIRRTAAASTTTTARPPLFRKQTTGSAVRVHRPQQNTSPEEDDDDVVINTTPSSPVKRIHLLGERNSGTNFLNEALVNAFRRYGLGRKNQHFQGGIPVLEYKHMVRTTKIGGLFVRPPLEHDVFCLTNTRITNRMTKIENTYSFGTAS